MKGIVLVPNCLRCNKQLKFWELLTPGSQQKYCKNCYMNIKQAFAFMEQTLFQMYANGGITSEKEHYIYQQQRQLGVPDEFAAQLIQRMQYWKYLTDIRNGHLPTIRTQKILDTDEIPHFETGATYHKPNKEIRYIPGRILATNKKIYFLSDSGTQSITIDCNNIVDVKTSGSSTFYIQVSKGSGGGHYTVSDPELTVTFIHTLVLIWKRHLVQLKEHPNTQDIPPHIKAAVFQRDRGTCVQCGYIGPYIEYDHCIPRSKGGSNTVENIQLLCGQCNRKKGTRI